MVIAVINNGGMIMTSASIVIHDINVCQLLLRRERERRHAFMTPLSPTGSLLLIYNMVEQQQAVTTEALLAILTHGR